MPGTASALQAIPPGFQSEARFKHTHFPSNSANAANTLPGTGGVGGEDYIILHS